MICESYSMDRLAGVYDTLNPPGEDMSYYLQLAGLEALSIPSSVSTCCHHRHVLQVFPSDGFGDSDKVVAPEDTTIHAAA